jgi:hypothetical protein
VAVLGPGLCYPASSAQQQRHIALRGASCVVTCAYAVACYAMPTGWIGYIYMLLSEPLGCQAACCFARFPQCHGMLRSISAPAGVVVHVRMADCGLNAVRSVGAWQHCMHALRAVVNSKPLSICMLWVCIGIWCMRLTLLQVLEQQ